MSAVGLDGWSTISESDLSVVGWSYRPTYMGLLSQGILGSELSACIIHYVLVYQSRNCLLSSCTASYISESELSAGIMHVPNILKYTGVGIFCCRPVGLLQVTPQIRNCLLLASFIYLTILESELSAVDLYCNLHLSLNRQLSAGFLYYQYYLVGIVCCWLLLYIYMGL